MNLFFDNSIDFLLAFISAILGLSVPIMLQVIERIDDKYDSTRLAERLKDEPVIRWCGVFLLVSLLSCIYALFIKAPSPWDCWIMNNSAYLLAFVSCLILIGLFLWSCIIVLAYYNPEKLQKEIVRRIEKSSEEKEKIRDIKDLVDLSKTVLDMSEREPAKIIYDVFSKEIGGIIDEAEDDSMVVPQYLSSAITSINENLCLMERRPFSINNGNQLLKMLIYNPVKLSDETYSLLWKNLILQLHYDEDDWIYEYWTAAVQIYDLNLRYTNSGYLRGVESETSKEESAEKRLSRRQHYYEFHIILCSYILHLKKYDLLGKLLWYTRVYPPDYPLVPSTLMEIVSVFKQMDDSPRLSYPIEAFYPFMDMKGIVDGEIQGAVKLYLSLLYLRLFSPMGLVVDTSLYVPDKLSQLKAYDSYFEYLEWGIEKLSEDPDVNLIMNVDKDNAKVIINSHRDEIRSAIKRIRDDGTLNENLINENERELRDYIVDKLTVYDNLFEIGGRLNPDVTYWIDGRVSYPYPNAAFMNDSDMSYVGMAATVGESTVERFQYFFTSVFFQTVKEFRYHIRDNELFEAIDILKVNSNYVLVSFNVYWDYYINSGQQEFRKRGKGVYAYRDIEIISLPSGQFPLMDQSVFILNKKDVPQVTFLDPSVEQIDAYHLSCLDEKYKLFASVIKLSQNKKLQDIVQNDLPHEVLGDKSLFSSFLTAKVDWSRFVSMVGIKLMYDLRDNGTADDLSTVKAIEDGDNLMKRKAMRSEAIAIFSLGKELGIELKQVRIGTIPAIDAEGVKDGKTVYLNTKYLSGKSIKFIERLGNDFNRIRDLKESFDYYLAIVSDVPKPKEEKDKILERIKVISDEIIVRFYSLYQE